MPPLREPNTASFAEIPDPLELTQAVKPPATPSRLAHAGPTRDVLARRRRTALLASCVWLLALLAGFGVRHDFGSLATAQLVWMELVPLLGALACIWLALAGGALGLGARPALLFTVGVFALLVPAALAFGSLSADSGGLGARQHATCFAMAFGGAFPPLLLLGLALPKTFVSRPHLRSALLGVAAGLGGALFVNLHCAAASRVHVGFAHHAPMLVLAVFAALWLGHKMRV